MLQKIRFVFFFLTKRPKTIVSWIIVQDDKNSNSFGWRNFPPWKFNMEYGGTFTKLFMHVSSRNMLPTIRNLQIRVHVYRPRHCCGDPASSHMTFYVSPSWACVLFRNNKQVVGRESVNAWKKVDFDGFREKGE
jgi:hypothetical protein